MKKTTFLAAVVTLCSITLKSQQWVGFSKSEPTVPELNILSSNTQTVSFEVTIPGIYTQDTTVNGTAFRRLVLPGGAAVNPAGSPELPALAYQIAIPECAGANVSYQVTSRQTMPSCWVYPVPEIVAEQNSEGMSIPVEQFAFNSAAYAQLRSVNLEPAAVVASDGSLRAQRFVEVRVQPVEFCPVNRTLSVIDKITVTLNFTNPQGALRQNTGIFNKVAAKAFINYNDDGTSAMVNDKAFEQAGFTPGNVQWITLTDTAQAKNIVADYLIICADQFFTPHNSDVQRLAEHRAFYNGFDVAILNVEHILSDAVGFYYEGNPDSTSNYDKYKKEQRIRTCIRRIYEGAHAQHTHDGKLAYVLLVGDCYEGNTGMPTSYDQKLWDAITYEVAASDYYYTCITNDTIGGYDMFGDLFIGRLSVENDTQLFNMVEKTIFFESEYDWRKSAGFTFGSGAISQTSTMNYCNFLNRIIKGWSYSVADYFDLNGVIEDSTFNYLNNGVTFAQYWGHGSKTEWEYINMADFSAKLNNEYKAPFINTIACLTGHFDNTGCLGEFLTRYDSTKGAVGYIGASCSVWVMGCGADTDGSWLEYSECYPYYLFRDTHTIAGELMLSSKRAGRSFMRQNMYAFNLFGDPALNILAEGYEITRDATADTAAVVYCPVKVHNNATLTVSDGVELKFLKNSQLIIEENANLVIGNNVQLYSQMIITWPRPNSVADTTWIQTATPAIHVKGGGFSVGSGVTFDHLNGGILLNSSVRYPFYDNTKVYSLNTVTFNSTPLTHCGTQLTVSNSIFNHGSNVNTSFSKITVDSCIFNQTTFFANQLLYSSSSAPSSFKGNTTVKNSFFSGSKTGTALRLEGSSLFTVSNNVITNYNTGIALNASGTSLALQNSPYQKPIVNRIFGNSVTNCVTGIELYNSTADIYANNVNSNTFGMRLFNNSNTSFNNSLYPRQHQIIKDNKLYELYASANSFPVIFKQNQIIDDDNTGNGYGDPLIYLDGSFISFNGRHNVNFNYWGNSFKPQDDLYPYQSFICDSIWTKSTSLPDEAETLYHAGLSNITDEDYDAAETQFMELIDDYPQSPFATAAMHELFALSQLTGNSFAALLNYYTTFTPADSTLFDTAEFLATRCLIMERNWQPAIDWYENRIENPPSYQDSIFAVIDLGALHLMMDADTADIELKSGIFLRYRLSELKPKSKNEYETNRANMLANLPQKNKTQMQLAVTEEGEKEMLWQNIPNPATESTTVTFELFAEGTVEIRIYNMLGQLFHAIPQGTLQQGINQVELPITHLPAGIYHYALFVDGKTADVKKMTVTD
ncbi:MAG: C25 family cysteine peptidase [Cytophagaceae bacterium]|jgi:hypothetical protein|nr:C25 family cysteine peptidase [Cytophagaceae bacterium]